jgi:hypothetical protein
MDECSKECGEINFAKAFGQALSEVSETEGKAINIGGLNLFVGPPAGKDFQKYMEDFMYSGTIFDRNKGGKRGVR